MDWEILLIFFLSINLFKTISFIAILAEQEALRIGKIWQVNVAIEKMTESPDHWTLL